MAALNPGVSYNQFVALAERDGIIFLGLIQVAKRIASWWLRFLILILLFVPMLILAQFVPFYFRELLLFRAQRVPTILHFPAFDKYSPRRIGRADRLNNLCLRQSKPSQTDRQ
jgi:hypothetical protein